MFRAVPLSIIRSFSLYTQQWYMSHSFVDSLTASRFRTFRPEPARCQGLPSGLFPSGFPTNTLYTPSPHTYAPHTQPISFFSILSPAQYWVRSTNHLAPRYGISSIPPLPRPSPVQYSPQHLVLKRPQLPFLPQCQRPSFTPIQNDRQIYSSVYLNL